MKRAGASGHRFVNDHPLREGEAAWTGEGERSPWRARCAWPRRRARRRPCRRSSTACRRTSSRRHRRTGSAARSGSQSNFDSDGDGKLDRIHVDFTLPEGDGDRRPEGPGHLRGQPVLRGTAAPNSNWVVDHELGAPPPRAAARAVLRRPRTRARRSAPTSSRPWLPRGFARRALRVARHRLLRRLPDRPARRTRTLGATAVIDWLNGRAQGLHDARPAHAEVAGRLDDRQGRR